MPQPKGKTAEDRSRRFTWDEDDVTVTPPPGERKPVKETGGEGKDSRFVWKEGDVIITPPKKKK